MPKTDCRASDWHWKSLEMRNPDLIKVDRRSHSLGDPTNFLHSPLHMLPHDVLAEPHKLTTQLRAGLDKAPFVFSNSESVACADFDLTTRADLFEKRKQQHIERGYRIEDERPIPVNGLCSFIAVSERPDSDLMSERVQLALDGKQRAHCTV